MKRRGFIFTILLPFIGTTNILVPRFYSIGSQVGNWAGWLQNGAGNVVAFFTKSGQVFWMPK